MDSLLWPCDWAPVSPDTKDQVGFPGWQCALPHIAVERNRDCRLNPLGENRWKLHVLSPGPCLVPFWAPLTSSASFHYNKPHPWVQQLFWVLWVLGTSEVAVCVRSEGGPGDFWNCRWRGLEGWGEICNYLEFFRAFLRVLSLQSQLSSEDSPLGLSALIHLTERGPAFQGVACASKQQHMDSSPSVQPKPHGERER